MFERRHVSSVWSQIETSWLDSVAGLRCLSWKCFSLCYISNDSKLNEQDKFSVHRYGCLNDVGCCGKCQSSYRNSKVDACWGWMCVFVSHLISSVQASVKNSSQNYNSTSTAAAAAATTVTTITAIHIKTIDKINKSSSTLRPLKIVSFSFWFLQYTRCGSAFELVAQHSHWNNIFIWFLTIKIDIILGAVFLNSSKKFASIPSEMVVVMVAECCRLCGESDTNVGAAREKHAPNQRQRANERKIQVEFNSIRWWSRSTNFLPRILFAHIFFILSFALLLLWTIAAHTFMYSFALDG